MFCVGPVKYSVAVGERRDGHQAKPNRRMLAGRRGPNPITSYKFIGFGDLHGPKPYQFMGFGDLHGPKPYKFIGFGDIRDPTRASLVHPGP